MPNPDLTRTHEELRMRQWAVLVFLGWATLSIASLHAGAQEGRAKPTVWMCPPAHENGRCLRELFEQPDAWKETRSLIDVLGYADHNLNRQFTDDQLRAWLPMLEKWGIKFGLEVGAVKPWGTTGEKVFNIQRTMWDRFQRLGGRIHAIAMDEPLCCTRQDLKKPDDYAVEETAAFIALVRKNYPQVLIGDIEPYPFIPLADLIQWIDALEKRLAAMGVRGLDFFRLDVDWVHFIVGNPGSWREVKTLEQTCRRRKLPFSLVYWAAGYPALKRRGLADDSTWHVLTMAQGYNYAMVDGSPDQVVVQSWVDAPSHFLPETAEFTFTRTVRDFCLRFVKPGR